MPAARPALPPLTLTLIALVLAGCGNDASPPPDIATPGPPIGAVLERDPGAGLAYQAPGGWSLRRGQAPLVATIATGRASINLFRYPRPEPLPDTPAKLDAAAKALAAAARQREPSFVLVKSDRLRVDGRPAVVLRGTQTVGGQPRTVRSTHVYAFGGEVVVDALAPARDFKRVDAQAFRTLVRSLRLSEPSA